MKNVLFTGIAGEGPSGIAHHLGCGVQYCSSDQSRAGPWRSRSVTTIGMPLLNKDGGEKYRCCTCAVLRCYRFTTLSDVAKRKINTRDNTVSKASPLLKSSLHRITEFISRRPCLQPPKPGRSEKNTYNCH